MRTTPGFRGPDLYNLAAAATGTVYQDKTCLHVEWAWLALPAALVVSTLAFFVGTLLSGGTLSDEARTWKSSPLALVFRGPTQTSAGWKNGRDDRDLQSMDAVAKVMNVRLIQDDNGGVRLQEHYVGKQTAT